MHGRIARAFAALLILVHVAVLGLAGLALFGGLGLAEGRSTAAVLFAALALFAGYVFLAGLASVAIRMNQNLERIAAALETRDARPTPTRQAGTEAPLLRAVPAPPKPAGRREPPLSGSGRPA